MWTTLQNISEISLTARYYMTLMTETGWKSKQLRHSVTISDWMCKPKMVYFLFHMIVYRSDSHSGHKPSLGNKKPTAHIFTPVGKYLDCSAQGPCCFCLSDRIIAERELTPAAAHSRERAQLCIWSCQSSTHKSIYASVGIGFSWPLRHHLLILYDEVIVWCCHGTDREGNKTAVAKFNNPICLWIPT